jgi:hypothetical protein
VDKARSMACADDGDDKTADFCDGAGLCIHKLKGLCTTTATSTKPTPPTREPCEACERGHLRDRVDLARPGLPLTTDGLACTRDVCDGSGACTHPCSPAA